MITMFVCPARIKVYLCLAIPLIGIVTLYFFYAGNQHIFNLYNWLGEAFLSGHTYMPTYLAPFLADASFFNGNFYLYWGPVPAVLVYIPIKLLTGIAVTESFIVPFTASIGTICLSILSYKIASHQRPVNGWGLIFVVLSIGLGSWLPFICRVPRVYEAAISSAYGFSAMGALFLWLFLSNQQRKYWAILASLCLGLAVGCRLNHIGNVFLLLVSCIVILRSSAQRTVRLGYILRLLGPWLLCMAALGVYNYERFGSPIDNGERYQRNYSIPQIFNSTVPQGSHSYLQFISSHYAPWFKMNSAPYHVYYYLFHPLQYTNPISFPNNVFEKSRPVIPWVDRFLTSKGYYAGFVERSVSGLFTNSPFSLWFLAFLCDRRIRKNWLPAARTLMTGIELYSGFVFLTLVGFVGITMRYGPDFAPWIVAAGGVYYLHLLQRIERVFPRRLLLIVGGIMTMYGVFTGTVFGYYQAGGYGVCE